MSVLRTTSGEALPLGKAASERRRNKILLGLFLFLAVAITAGIMIKIDRYTVASGYVTTEHYAEVRSPVTGIVGKILVTSGAVVEAGQVLVQLNAE